MKKSTRGALAASAAALLLIGGMGTRASWSDTGNVPGTAVGTGHLKLINADCDGWLISGNLFDPASIKIAPGSVLTQVCTFEVDAVGVNLKANLSVTTPQLGGDADLASALNVVATYKLGTDPIGATTVLNDGDVVTATMKLTLPSTVGNAVQDLDASLQDVTVTATQA